MRVESGFSRRTFLSLAATAASYTFLAGCGGGTLFEEGGGGLLLRPRTLSLNPTAAVIATDRGRSTSFLGSFSDDGLQGSVWGVKSDDSTIVESTQLLVWDKTADESARVIRDGRGLPSQVIDETNGSFLVVIWEADRATFKLFQPDGSYIGGCEATGRTGAYTFKQLQDSKVVGYFSGALQGATDGIFAVTVGGREQAAPPKPESHRGVPSPGLPRAVDTTVAQKLTDTLAGTLKSDQFTAFAVDLLDDFKREYFSSGRSQTFEAITAKALAGTGLAGFFRDGGSAILRGILSGVRLREIALDYSERLRKKSDLTGLDFVENPPGLIGYVSSVNLVQPNEATDKTGVVGVVLAREFGTIPIYGVIDGTGRLAAAGTGNGAHFSMTATVSGDDLAGNWQSNESNRGPAGSGSMSGTRRPLGQCSAQQLSGGQGTFTNAYDLQTCGRFPFSYEAYTIPDHFIVINGSDVIFDTGGPISGGGTVQLGVHGNSTIVQVTVEAPNEGTLWNYTVGCPD